MTDYQAQLLQSLADKLGTTTAYLWGVLIKQAHIAVFMQFADALILTGILVVFFFVGRWLYHSAKQVSDGLDAMPQWIGIVILFIAGGVVICAIVASFEGSLTALINPEYWALNKVLETIKK